MLITLYGPDSYRRLRKLGELAEAFKAKHSNLSYERIDLAEENASDRLKVHLTNRSIFNPVRLIVLDNILESPEPKKVKELLNTYGGEKDTTIIVNSAKKPPATHKFLLEGATKSQEFKDLKGVELAAFIEMLGKERGVELEAGAIRSLAELFGSNAWGIATEIEAMSFSSSRKADAPRATDYFRLVNIIKRGRNVKERLVALEAVMSIRKDEPARVFNSIAYRPGTAAEARRFAEYDVAVKSGKLEYEEVLVSLALGP